MPVPSWQPTELIEIVAREPLAVMRKGVGAAPFLIVRLDDFSTDLKLGLVAADAADDRRRVNRAIKSTLQISVAMTEQLRVLKPEQVLLAKQAEEKPAEPGAGFPVPEWLTASCYVVRLSNRGDGPGPLSIGRDPNHKIVLLHPSVSASHAQLTLGPELSLRDTNSRNGTFVNGAPVKGAVPLRLGDRIKFGAVQTMLCGATEFWHAVR